MARRIISIVAATITGAAPAQAQDASMAPMNFSVQTKALASSAIGSISVGETARRGGGGVRNGPRGGAAPAYSLRGRSSDGRLPFVTTPPSQRQAVADYLARLARNIPPCCIIGGGVQNAPRDGKVAEHRRFVARFHRDTTGQDLGRPGLSPAGFIRR